MKKITWWGCIDDPKTLAGEAIRRAQRQEGRFGVNVQKLLDELPERLRDPVMTEVLAILLRRCEGCGAEPGEACRITCLSREEP